MRNSIINAKKSSIPVTVLVILTIALCIFALISFSLASKKKADGAKSDNFLDALYLMKGNLNSGYQSPSGITGNFDSVNLDRDVVTLEKQDYNWAVGWWGILPYPKKDKFVLYRAEYPIYP